MPDGTLFDLPAVPRVRRPRRRKDSDTAPRPWPLDGGLNVVLFAGRGGACQGLEEAGYPVHVAVNHDAVAIAVHQALHPHTRHYQTDVLDLCPREVTGGRRVNILWASPDCRHFSRAKGGKPVSRRVRSLPWVVVRWAAQVQPTVLFTENVSELRTWGPLVALRDPATKRVLKADGSVAAKGERVPVEDQLLVPDPRRRGRTFRAWLRALGRAGYAVEHRDLCCADYGVPTSRTRFFLIGRRDGLPAVWPERTHAPRTVAADLGLLPWRGAWEIIDWSLPAPSIFLTPEEARPLGIRRPLAPATERRVARGVVRYVLEAAEPFLVPVTHAGDSRCHSVQEPLRTLTTARRGEHAVVVPTLIQVGYGERDGQAPRVPGLDKPLGTLVAGGAKHAIVTAFLAKHYGGGYEGAGSDLAQPLHTVTVSDHHAVVACHLTKLRGRGADGQALAEPLPTLTTSGGHVAHVAALLVKYYSEGGTDQDAREPLHTITTKARMGVVTVPILGETYVLADIGQRMLQPHEAEAAHELLPAPATIVVDGQLRRLTKEQRMAGVGNSVPPRMPRLLATCNAPVALTVAAE